MWGGIGGTGFTTATRRWHGLRLCMVIVPQHTDIYIYYRVRGSHVLLLLSVSVSVGCECVCVLGMGRCCPHTRYSGLCCCCCCLAGCPPSSGGAAVHMALACAQFNYAVFVRGRYSHIWCVCVPRTHAPTPPSTLSPPTRTLHMSSRACIPKVIYIYI